LYYAALARSEADWIVGINATRALTTKYDAQLSLGRVQTPTIQLVQMRQNEINHFAPQMYFTMKVIADGLTFQSVNPQSATDKTVFENIKKIGRATSELQSLHNDIPILMQHVH